MSWRHIHIRVLTHLSRPTVAIGGAVLLGAVAIGGAWVLTNVAPSGTVAQAAYGPITEEVDVTGTVKAAEHMELSFPVSGQVAAIPAVVGAHVAAGDTLIALSNGSEQAAVALAKANLETQEARLAALLAGTRPEQLALDETAATQASSALSDAIRSAAVTADDAIHAKADQAFINPRVASAALAVSVADATLTNRVVAERIALEPVVASLVATAQGSTDPMAAAASVEAALRQIAAFLDDLAMALSEASPTGQFSAATLASIQASVNTARLNVSNAQTALTGADTAAKTAAGALVLAKAGATANDIAAGQAAADAARAALTAAQVALGKTYLAAPAAGTIASQDADLGETVAPGQVLVTMISDGTYQADALVSEADIAKIAVGDTVDASLAAYPGITFPASVTTVAPAAAITNGVSSYKITITFAKNDPRIVPGLAATLRIITQTKDRALLIPARAIITDGADRFVYVQGPKGPVQTPVTVGIESANGMAEIVGGLTEGEKVLSFGGR